MNCVVRFRRGAEPRIHTTVIYNSMVCNSSGTSDDAMPQEDGIVEKNNFTWIRNRSAHIADSLYTMTFLPLWVIGSLLTCVSILWKRGTVSWMHIYVPSTHHSTQRIGPENYVSQNLWEAYIHTLKSAYNTKTQCYNLYTYSELIFRSYSNKVHGKGKK